MDRYQAIKDIYKKIDEKKERVSEIKKEMDGRNQLNSIDKYLLRKELKLLHHNQIELLREIEQLVMLAD